MAARHAGGPYNRRRESPAFSVLGRGFVRARSPGARPGTCHDTCHDPGHSPRRGADSGRRHPRWFAATPSPWRRGDRTGTHPRGGRPVGLVGGPHHRGVRPRHRARLHRHALARRREPDPPRPAPGGSPARAGHHDDRDQPRWWWAGRHRGAADTPPHARDWRERGAAGGAWGDSRPYRRQRAAGADSRRARADERGRPRGDGQRRVRRVERVVLHAWLVRRDRRGDRTDACGRRDARPECRAHESHPRRRHLLGGRPRGGRRDHRHRRAVRDDGHRHAHEGARSRCLGQDA